jgi:hypothetical protein
MQLSLKRTVCFLTSVTIDFCDSAILAVSITLDDPAVAEPTNTRQANHLIAPFFNDYWIPF